MSYATHIHDAYKMSKKIHSFAFDLTIDKKRVPATQIIQDFYLSVMANDSDKEYDEIKRSLRSYKSANTVFKKTVSTMQELLKDAYGETRKAELEARAYALISGITTGLLIGATYIITV